MGVFRAKYITEILFVQLMKGCVSIGVVGVGRFGKNYLRTFYEMEDSSVKWVCAGNEQSLKEAVSIGIRSKTECTLNYRDVLDDPDVDAVAIVTPGSTHFSLAKEALDSGKHVIVEKPPAFSSVKFAELVAAAKKARRLLMVSDIHRFNPGILKLREDIGKGLFGKLNYMYFSHFGNGPVRSDMSALWDFFPHSASVSLYLAGSTHSSVCASGASFIKEGIEDMVSMSIRFKNGVFASANAGWLYPSKKMEVVVAGEKMFAVFDDYAAKDKLKYFLNRPSVVGGRVVFEDKGVVVPELGTEKPLTGQLRHFLQCIRNGELSGNCREYADVMKLLDAAQTSMEMKENMKY